MTNNTPQPVTNANPGSPYAVEHGCLCAIMDNANGAGAYGGAAKGKDGEPLFWITEGCPLHGNPNPNERSTFELTQAEPS